MIFYNKKAFAKAGIDAENPPLAHLRRVPRHREARSSSGRRREVRDLPGAVERVLPVLVRLLPAVRGRDRRQAAGRGRQGDVRPPTRARGSPQFWQTIYADKLAGKEKYNGDAFADGTAAMAIVGPWAIAAYKDKVDWGVGAGADLAGQAGERDPHLQRREERRDVLRVQEPRHRVGLAEVRHQQGAGRQVARDDRPDAAAHRTCSRRTPTTSPRTRSTRSSRTRPRARVEVPNVPNSIAIWQAFRDAYVQVGDLRQGATRAQALDRTRPRRSTNSPSQS